jgi:hypothetical protein
MLVKKVIETDKGTVKFEGELEEAELDLIIRIGLNYLLAQGALPFTTNMGMSVPDTEYSQ